MESSIIAMRLPHFGMSEAGQEAAMLEATC
jgi:hypothetical protein